MYPKQKYAPAGGSVTVENEFQERALGPGWTDTAPVAAPEAPETKPKKGKK